MASPHQKTPEQLKLTKQTNYVAQTSQEKLSQFSCYSLKSIDFSNTPYFY